MGRSGEGTAEERWIVRRRDCDVREMAWRMSDRSSAMACLSEGMWNGLSLAGLSLAGWMWNGLSLAVCWLEVDCKHGGLLRHSDLFGSERELVGLL